VVAGRVCGCEDHGMTEDRPVVDREQPAVAAVGV
jgi:hypothetical protein